MQMIVVELGVIIGLLLVMAWARLERLLEDLKAQQASRAKQQLWARREQWIEGVEHRTGRVYRVHTRSFETAGEPSLPVEVAEEQFGWKG